MPRLSRYSIPQPQCRRSHRRYATSRLKSPIWKRATARELIRTAFPSVSAPLFHSVLIGKAMVCTLDRAGIEREMARCRLHASSNGQSARRKC